MGFFKRLKERIFRLKVNDETKEEILAKEEKARQERVAQKEEVTQAKGIQKLEDEYYKKHDANKYVAGLAKINNSFSRKIMELQTSHHQIDEDFFDDLEEILIMSDISAKLVMIIVNEIKKEVKINNITDIKLINEIVVDKMFMVYANKTVVDTTLNFEDNRLNVFIVIGVNGSGKTTSIAKLAHNYQKQGKKVLVAAADTFRAGAVDQLEKWTQRIGCEIVKSEKVNGDPASVVYKGLEKAKAENYDLLIIDTAGRLQNKVNLMNELEKMYKILRNTDATMPHECLLVLDATTGQNAISQVREFNSITNLSGLILTKMDGTSKGGIVVSIKDEFDLDVKLLGLGEGLDDLKEFDLDNFIYGMTNSLMEQ
ncbi:cell division protein FTSY [Mycoplasmopsis californica]|uniref:Signal recognition particle receptor FtsY n=1 Tax=Mycoplasmopsis equigenitalium TaxID=114883 RepID=A0ABY5J2X1_9BACT|nr:signal recognition particle-docking protein FtsY [Mycoplasmopsis equigenitalium]UUD36881.1 signal recognition particle-docking protein FtsY [Mycoplasmopsis equigenitalium]VEU69824.1 cell division protein FTSY [Mycoplasmopsis californica]